MHVGTPAREAKVIIQAIPGWGEALRDLLKGLEFCTAEGAMQAIAGVQMYTQELWAKHVPMPERTSFAAMLVRMMDTNPNRSAGIPAHPGSLSLAI